MDPSRREALERHCAQCPECRGFLLELGKATDEPVPARGSRWPALAAASLFLAGAAWWAISRPAPPLFPPKPPAPVEAVSETLFGSSVLLTLRPGGKVEREGGAWVLRKGLLRIESPGEPCRLCLGSLQVDLQEGILLAAIEPCPVSLLLREASAGEGDASLTLLEGKARIDGRDVTAPATIGFPLSWPDEGWRSLGDPFVLDEDSRVLLADPGPSYVFEALVRKHDASAELGFVFPAGNRCWELPLGADLLPVQERWSRIRISADPRACRATLGEREVLSSTVESLRLKIPTGSGGGLGLKAWGGAVEVRLTRWRPLR